MNILGIWDGHDAGAALLMAKRLVCAVNEERFTRRKLEVVFPRHAIAACLNQGGITPAQIDRIVCSTSDPAKTLTRLWPGSKERYYRLRRRLDLPSPLNPFIKLVKYRLTEWHGNRMTHWLSSHSLRARLKEAGFVDPSRFILLDHHLCHAGGVYFSGLDQAIVITLDGVGDGLAGSIYLFEAGRLQRLATVEARHSIGLFFEQVTHLLNMRELEDEGKVMALADFSLPIADQDNPLLDLFWVDGLQLRGRVHANGLTKRLKEVLWSCTTEQFAAMAQRTLEARVVEWVQNALTFTQASHVVLAGGVFANVKLNGLIRNLPDVKSCFVSPHMGDGGLALGAAAVMNQTSIALNDLYLGTQYSTKEILATLQKSHLSYRQPDDLIEEVALLLVSGQVIGWFQGRMEYGPRALGGRSILALPGLPDIRDKLNLRLKKRSWYQPFCPSMLEQEADRLLSDYTGPPDRFMTSIYQVRPEFRQPLSGVISRDGSCRPQMVLKDSGRFAHLLERVQAKTGYGILLNTSFNAHGMPMVCSPQDALDAFVGMGIDYLILDDWLIQKTSNY